jgi:hypothetical protein
VIVTVNNGKLPMTPTSPLEIRTLADQAFDKIVTAIGNVPVSFDERQGAVDKLHHDALERKYRNGAARP